MKKKKEEKQRDFVSIHNEESLVQGHKEKVQAVDSGTKMLKMEKEEQGTICDGLRNPQRSRLTDDHLSFS